MKCKILWTSSDWEEIRRVCLHTVGKNISNSDVDSAWKLRLLKSEHSPIRMLTVRACWTDLPYWVSTHFVRHKIGIEHYVRSQRQDLTGVPRSELRQDALVVHEFMANAQSIINISRKRLCYKASPETRKAWVLFLNELALYEPELVQCCMPDCDYRGQCHEITPCT